MVRARAQPIVPQPERSEELHECQQVTLPNILCDQLQMLTCLVGTQAVIKV
jgi:hypothetical protein